MLCGINDTAKDCFPTYSDLLPGGGGGEIIASRQCGAMFCGQEITGMKEFEVGCQFLSLKSGNHARVYVTRWEDHRQD